VGKLFLVWVSPTPGVGGGVFLFFSRE
jgi:hypothetical protein